MTSPLDASAFATRLRALADLYDQNPDLPTTNAPLAVYAHRTNYSDVGLVEYRKGFALALRLAVEPPVIDDYYVRVTVAPGFQLNFDKSAVGTKRTVTREVEEYVLDADTWSTPPTGSRCTPTSAANAPATRSS